MSEYKIVYKGGTGEIVEKKSRFIANVFKVESEDEALEIRTLDARVFNVPATSSAL